MLEWKDEVEKVIGNGRPSVLVGNKIDLADQGTREVGTTDGEALKEEMNSISYYEASAKQNIQVEDIFQEVTLAILKNTQKK
jgi:GTPase SAR1 family protein